MKIRNGILAVTAALALVIGAAVLTAQDKKADVSKVNRVVGDSAGCTLLELRYHADVENKYGTDTMRYRQEHQKELLIAESSFRTDETVAGSGFSPNHTYNGWQWHLVRTQDKAGWEVVDWGY